MTLVGVSALAAALGIGKGTISKQAAAGKIPVAERDKKGNPLFDIDAVRAAREANLNPLMRRAAETTGATGEEQDDDDAGDVPGERRSGPAPRSPSALVEQQKLEKQLKNRRLLRQVVDDEGLLVLKAVVEETTMTLSRRTRDGVTGLMTDKASALYAFIGQQPRTEPELRVWLQDTTAQAFNDTAHAIAAEDGDEFDDADAVDEPDDPQPDAAAEAAAGA
ncbi:MAG: hypothetical protein KIS73_24715 [Enhydrobacter sp.]|nr:hypothetical protein [Enhydrobacter sp.]